jgi:hypothetical protein
LRARKKILKLIKISGKFLKTILFAQFPALYQFSNKQFKNTIISCSGSFIKLFSNDTEMKNSLKGGVIFFEGFVIIEK